MEKLEFKGTGGEWSLSRATLSRYEIIKPDHKWKGYDKLISSVAVETEMEDDYNEDVANAHLIAASKDLLEACIADVRNMYDGEEHVGYQVDGMNGRVLCTFELTEFDHACQYVENLRKAAISKALNTTSND